MSYADLFQTKKTPQSEQADPQQVQNSAGGYTFALDKWARLERWLVLGSEGGTYYSSAKKLTRENALTVTECLKEDAAHTVRTIVDMSVSGRAPKNDPAIFALAIAASAESQESRKLAVAHLSDVCRIGTHLFQFVAAVEGFRGWGRGLRRAIGNWYVTKDPRELQVQVLKYQAREGWSHRDVLRLGHVRAATDEQQAVLRWVACHAALGENAGQSRAVKGHGARKDRQYSELAIPEMLADYEKLKTTTDLDELLRLIEKHGYTHEMLPSEAKAYPRIWEALLSKMPITAMIRNLNKMTAVGLLAPMSDAAKVVRTRLTDAEVLKKARVHPIQALSALRTYSQGHGERGKLTWAPVREVVDALDEAFYLSFASITPTGKNVLLALDVSGSMDGGEVAGVAGLTPRLGAAAMAMVTARSEQNWHCVGFSSGAPGEFCFGGERTCWGGRSGITELSISPRQRLDDVVTTMKSVPMGGTDCALPMIYAAARDLKVDAFCVYTDNETWAGNVHPHQALRAYRDKTGINAKLAVVAMTATEFSIADPADAGMLDFIGFDAAAPSVMADFIRR